MAPSWKGGEGQPSVGSNPTSSSIGKDSIFVWCSTGHRARLVGLNEKPSARGCAQKISHTYMGVSHSGDCNGLQNRRRKSTQVRVLAPSPLQSATSARKSGVINHGFRMRVKRGYSDSGYNPWRPANETSSVLLSSCGGTSRFGVNRLLARRIDTALKTKTSRSGKWLKLSRQINNGVPASCKRRNRHSAHFTAKGICYYG